MHVLFHIMSSILFLILGTTATHAQYISRRSEQWTRVDQQTNLDKSWFWHSDLGYRWKDGFQQRSQYIARTSLGYHINPNLSIAIGLAGLGSYDSVSINRFEARPYQEIKSKQNLKPVKIFLKNNIK